MAVYVDPLFTMQARGSQAFAVGQRNGHRWCHLFADTTSELREFARKIGLDPKWVQTRGEIVHYDLTPDRRERAVKAGARELSREEAVAIWRRLRAARLLAQGRTAGLPDDVIVTRIRAISDGNAREVEAVIAAEKGGSAP